MSSSRFTSPFQVPPPPFTFSFIRAAVVSHSEARRQRFRDALAEAGFDVDLFASASDAIPAIRRQPPSLLVVSDDLKASLDAVGLLKWLATQDFHHSVHSLVICRTDHQERAEQLLEVGACDLVSDDFSEALFKERLVIAEFRSAYLQEHLAQSALLKREASQYQTIVKHWPQAAIVAPNLSRPIKEVNSRALEILGLNEGQVVGKYLSLLMPDLFESEGFAPYSDFSKEPARIEDVRYEGPDGPVHLEVRIVGLEWSGEGAVLVTFENLQRLKAIERQRSRLSQAESLRRFASEMAHEFNNILTVVNGNLSLMEHLAMPDASLPLISSSLKACARASTMVKRLTQQPLQAVPRIRVLDPDRIVSCACEKAHLPDAIKPKIGSVENLWAVAADPGLIEDILVGLLRNAYEADSGGVIEVDLDNVTLTETTALPLEPGRYVRIAVIDAGPGMSKEVSSRAFEPFYTTKQGAEGMGLTRALEIAKKHAGTLEIEDSPLGHGVSVALYLPADDTPLESASASIGEDATPPPVAAMSTDGPRPKVLFMDDEPDIRFIVKRILEAKGFEVTTTESGEEAVEAYYRAERAGAAYDVLLLDLEVRGGMGAKETVALLHQDFPQIKAIVTTGYLDDSVLANHREHGFSGVLTKPFQVDDLVNILQRLMTAGG